MKVWGGLKIRCFREDKAQSLTELATFGSALLLVMSFFIRYGMNYIYQQDINMRAFRTALADAYTVAPRSNSSLILIKDKHIPDPRDTFGIGNVVSVQGRGDVVWGNNLQDKPILPSGLPNPSGLPKIKFMINAGTYEYTTADFGVLTQDTNPAGFYVKLSSRETRDFITWDRVRAFLPETTEPGAEVEPQAMVLLPGNETEIISEVASSLDSPLKEIIALQPDSLSYGDPVTGFWVLDRQAGQINPDYFALNADLYDDGNYDGNPDVTPENLQGLLLSETRVNRGDTLGLEERSGRGGYYKSADNIATTATVTHRIRHNTGIDSFVQENEVKGASKTWQTQK